MKKEVKTKVKKLEEVKLSDIIVEKITTEKRVFVPTFNKVEVLTKVPLPDGCIRCIVLIDHNGMLDNLRAGDIVDLPDRRYKTLAIRGLVKEYKGEGQPNKRR